MLEHTLDRAVMTAGPERVITVINRHRRPLLQAPRPLQISGRISPGKRLPDSHTSLVSNFKEKPRYEEAQKLRREGGLWNTMIIVARAGALWDMAKILYPGMIARFEALKPWMGTDEEDAAIDLVYRKMPEINFSHGLLEKVAEWAVVLPLDGVYWSDWGRPQRIEETLDSTGAKSVLPRVNARRAPAVAAAAA